MLNSNSGPEKGYFYKLYINPGPEIAKFVIPFMQKCNEASLPTRLKIMEPFEVKNETRSDVVNIYTTSPQNIKKICEILTQVVEENNIELRRKTKEFSISLDQNDTIGLGYDNIMLNRSWSGRMEDVLAREIREYFKENGDLTGDDIARIKEEFPEKYAAFCEDLYKKLNEQCTGQAKKIVGLQVIMTTQPTKLTSRDTKNISSSTLEEGKVQINGLIGNIKYNQNRKGYIISYDDGKALYTSDTILDAFNRGEITYSREKENKNDSAEPINKKQQNQSATREKMNLPEGAKWKLNSRGEYVLQIIIDSKNKTTQTYSAEVATRKYGILPPNLQNHEKSTQDLGVETWDEQRDSSSKRKVNNSIEKQKTKNKNKRFK